MAPAASCRAGRCARRSARPATSAGAPLANVINWFGQEPWARWLMEKVAGIDRRRSLPPLHADHFRAWFARHKPDANAGRVGQVILLDDCFTTFNEPQIGRAAV